MNDNTVDVKVDWFSYTVPLISGTVDQSPDTIGFMLKTVNSFVSGALQPILDACQWELQNTGGFYSIRLVDTKSTFRISWGDTNKHVYVEIPGTACQLLRDAGTLDTVILQAASRCSRIDIAGDWETELEPRAIIGNEYEKGRRAFSQIRSNEGLTVYVGSRKSDRFMRVYRYREPHPRHKLLRIEHENKGDAAKTVCHTFQTAGLPSTFKSLCNSYKWDIEAIHEFTAIEGKVRTNRNSTDDARTLLWLLETVAPSLAKAAQSGIINLDDFIEIEVKAKMPSP